MAQQIIDFGAFPNDPAADPIRAAFAKVQNNFTDLYSATLNTGVQSLQTGPGLTQNRTTGNVVVSANISNITIQTGPGLFVSAGVAGTSNSATVNSFNTPFVITLSPNVTTGNVSATNLSGTIRTGAQPFITSVGTLSNLAVTGGISASSFSGNVSGGQISGIFSAPGSNTQILFNNRGNIGAASNLVYTGTTLTFSGAMTVVGNITARNIDGGNLVSANYFQGTFLGPAANASTVSASSQPNITSVGVLSSLQVAGTLNAPTVSGNLLGNVTGNVIGNLIGTAANSVTVTASNQPNITSVGNLLLLNVDGNANIGNISATYVTAALTADAYNQPNIRKVGLLDGLQVSGTMEGGNITLSGNFSAPNMSVTTFSATNMTGNLLGNVSGNISGNVSGNISGNISGNVSGNISIPGQNTYVVFNDGGLANTHSGMSYNRTTALLSITGNVAGGNLTSTGIMFATVAANVGRVESASRAIALAASNPITYSGTRVTVTTATAHGLTVGNEVTLSGITGPTLAGPTSEPNGNWSVDTVPSSTSFTFVTASTYTGTFGGTQVLTALGTVSATGTIRGANLVTNGFLQVQGNASVGNITTTTLNGAVVSVSGNVSGANLLASGVIRVLGTSNLFGGASINGTDINNGNITTPNINVTTKLTTLDLSARGNLDGANISTGGILSVTGNASAGNLSTGIIIATGNIQGGAGTNISIGGNFVTTSTIQSAIVRATGTANITGTANVGALETAGTITATGNINANAATVNAANLVATNTLTGGNLVTPGTLAVTGNATVGNLGATTMSGVTLIASGNVSGANLVASGLLSVIGNASVGNVGTRHVVATGDITAASGTLTSNVANANLINAGNVLSGNVFANTGLMRALNTTVTGQATLLHVAASGTAAFTGATFTVSGSATLGEVASVGNVTSSANIQAANLVATNTLTGGNLTTPGVLSVTGNANTGNVGTQHVVATGNVSASGALSVTGNASTGNLGTTHVVAAGNISALGGTVFANVANANTINTGNLSTTGNLYANSGLIKALNTTVTGQMSAVHLDANGNVNFSNAQATFVVAANANIGNIQNVMHITSTGDFTSLNGTVKSLNANVTGLHTAGNLRIVADANIAGNSTHGNIESLGLLNVRGNANIGNIGITHIVASGNANVSGAMTVNGQANVGNLSFPPTATIALTSVTFSGTTVTVTTAIAHGLSVGNEIVLAGLTASTNAPNGIFLIASTPSASTFTYTAASVPTGALGFVSATLTVRPLITSQGSGIFGGRLSVGGDASFGNIPAVLHITASGNVQAAFMASGNANVSSNLNVGGTANLNNVNMTGVLGTTGGANFGSGNAVFYANGAANLSGNIGAPHVFVSGNVEAGILKSTGIMFATGNVTGGNLVTNGLLTVQGNASVGNITTARIDGTLVSVSGNVSGANLVASGVLSVAGTANVGNLNLPSTLVGISSVSYSGTTITVVTTTAHGATTGTEITLSGITTSGANPPNVGGVNPGWFVITVVNTTTFTFTAVAPSGTLNFSSGSLNIRPFMVSTGSASYGGNLTATGAVVATSFTGNGSTLTSINGANVSKVGSATNADTATNAGTVTGASQPNITSVGQLLSLAVGASGVNLYANGAANFSGNLNAAYIQANGSLITSINGANVSKVGSATNADSAGTAGTVTNAAQTNITSVGTLTGLNINGSIGSVTNITASGFVMHSAGVGLTATGTTQGAAAALTKQINVVATSAAGVNDGVMLPAAAAGMTCIVINTSAANVKVYPTSGVNIDSLGTNTSFTQGPGARLMYVAVSTSQWYTMTAVYG